MADYLTETKKTLVALVESLRPYLDLPCVCDESSVKAKEETLPRCTRCHVESAFYETIEQAQNEAEYVHHLAEKHPAQPMRTEPRAAANVVKFHPAARKAQPDAIWKP